ncbi:MAG: HIT family protein [Rhizobiaceae bacterium]
MSEENDETFRLDSRLSWASEHVLWLGLCELRLMNDRRWPWLLLIPQRPTIEEIHDLTPLDQAMLTFETNLAAATLKAMTGCDKINTGALGNVVPQLHIHVVARNQGDENWPGPVWGHGERRAYDVAGLEEMTEALRSAFDAATSQIRDDA